MLRALRQYLAEEGQEALDCLESIAEIERGEYHTLEEVLAEMDQKIAELKGKRAAE